MICPDCGFNFFDGQHCTLCDGQWEIWELQFSPLPLPEIRAQVAAWLGQLPAPAMFELAGSENGLKLRLYAPIGTVNGALQAWAAMTHQQTRWKLVGTGLRFQGQTHILQASTVLPELSIASEQTDPLLAVGGQLLNKGNTALRLWVIGRGAALQERLRTLSAYAYGTEGGVSGETPNPLAIRLTLWRGLLVTGFFTAGISAGAWAVGWLGFAPGFLGVLSGGLMTIVASLGMREWLRWRSIPKESLDRRLNDALLQVAISLHGMKQNELRLFDGEQTWKSIQTDWPAVRSCTLPITASDLAALISPPQAGEGSGILDRSVLQEVPAPPPSQTLCEAPFKIGVSSGSGQWIGIDPDGHGLATGGSRTGKTSFAYSLLKRLVEKGDDAPGPVSFWWTRIFPWRMPS